MGGTGVAALHTVSKRALHLQPGATFVGMMLGAIPSTAFYKEHSRIVRERTEEVSKALNTHHRRNLVTHPFAFVNRKGDIVLVSGTRMEKALANAQRTFLKHVLPARYRIERY